MKQVKWILYALLSFLPLGITLAILPGLPEQIPAHYGLDGTVDRWGSRYETLIFPAIILLFSALMLVLTRLAARQEDRTGMWLCSPVCWGWCCSTG